MFIQSVFIAGISGKLFQSSKSYVVQKFLSLKFSLPLLLYKKLTLSNRSFRRWACYLPTLRRWEWYLLNFIPSKFLHCRYYGKFVLKLEKLRWMHIFTIEMFFFAISVQKIEFEQAQFRRLDVALTEFYLFELFSYPILGESSFESPKVLLN